MSDGGACTRPATMFDDLGLVGDLQSRRGLPAHNDGMILLQLPGVQVDIEKVGYRHGFKDVQRLNYTVPDFLCTFDIV